MWQNSCITLYLTVLMTKCYESVSHQQTRAQNILDIRRKAKFNIIPHPLEATLNFLSPWEIYLSLLSDCNITMMKQHQQNSNANSTITSEVHETFYVFSSPKKTVKEEKLLQYCVVQHMSQNEPQNPLCQINPCQAQKAPRSGNISRREKVELERGFRRNFTINPNSLAT